MHIDRASHDDDHAESKNNRNVKYFNLEKQLQRDEYHPVLIFGTISSGKSAFLQSMIYYGATAPDAGFLVTKGENIYPADYPDQASLYSRFIDFFENEVIKQRSDGRYPMRTDVAGHYLLPVVLKPLNAELPIQKFVYLEGSGEVMNPEKGKAADGVGQYPQVTELALDFIKHYESPLSVIFIAPSHIKAGIEVSRATSGRCLSDCMRQYFALRPESYQYKDNLCLMITKWDRLCQALSGSQGGQLYKYDRSLVEDAYPKVLDTVLEWDDLWTSFTVQPDYRGSRFLMPYSSGVDIDGRIELKHAQQADFDYFNRTVWNWLYGNATALYKRSERARRKVLCPDTVAFTPRTFGLIEKYSVRFVASKVF